MTTYIARMHKDDGSDFGVEFVDFPGCVTAANNIQDLQRSAIEALMLHVEGMLEDGDEVPEPTSLDAYTADPDMDPRLPILLIDIPLSPPKSVRVNVTLPEDILTAIDRVSHNRSRFLAEAAREKLRAA